MGHTVWFQKPDLYQAYDGLELQLQLDKVVRIWRYSDSSNHLNIMVHVTASQWSFRKLSHLPAPQCLFITFLVLSTWKISKASSINFCEHVWYLFHFHSETKRIYENRSKINLIHAFSQRLCVSRQFVIHTIRLVFISASDSGIRSVQMNTKTSCDMTTWILLNSLITSKVIPLPLWLIINHSFFEPFL